MHKKQKEMLCAIGMMSGTSFDGIDAAIIYSNGKNKIELSDGFTLEYPSLLQSKLRNIKSARLEEILLIEDEITKLHIEAIHQVLHLNRLHPRDVDIIGFHGQTILHLPPQRLTWQLGNPSLLAHMTKIDVISDFRRKDLAAGGLGAPLVPIFHKALADGFPKPLAFLNIGGVTNITFIDQEQLIAFDTGPGNAPIDDLVNKKLGLKYDDKGNIASRGKVHYDIVHDFLNHSYFQKPFPKALDREGFNFSFLENINTEDGVATLSMIIAFSVKTAIDMLPAKPKQLFICGGGVKNLFIMRALHEILQIPIHNTEIITIAGKSLDANLVEAYAFGYLAIRNLKNLPSSFHSTTGCRDMQGIICGVYCKK